MNHTILTGDGVGRGQAPSRRPPPCGYPHHPRSPREDQRKTEMVGSEVLSLDRHHLGAVPCGRIPLQGLGVQLEEAHSPVVEGEDPLCLRPLPQDHERCRERLHGGEPEGPAEVHRVRRQEKRERPPAAPGSDDGRVQHLPGAVQHRDRRGVPVSGGEGLLCHRVQEERPPRDSPQPGKDPDEIVPLHLLHRAFPGVAGVVPVREERHH